MGRVKRRTTFDTQKLVFTAVMTAIIVVMQVIAVLTRAFLPLFSLNLVLIPIVIGAACGGVYVGAWLGFVSGLAVLISGDASAFLAVNEIGTVVTVLLKGAASGAAAAGVYKLLERVDRYLAVIGAAIVCPIVNTGIFVLGCYTFFLDTIRAWGEGAGMENAFVFILLGMIGINFIIELMLNIILSPVAVTLLNIRQKQTK